MPQKIVVNGIEYPSLEAMPPEVRRQYERALQLIQDVATGAAAAPRGVTEKTVATGLDGVSVKIHTKRVQYTVDGKTYDDLAQLPPGIRARVEQALDGAATLEVRDERPREIRVVDVHTEVSPRSRAAQIVLWLLIAAIVAVVVFSRL